MLLCKLDGEHVLNERKGVLVGLKTRSSVKSQLQFMCAPSRQAKVLV
jgi:hypothetical protein